MRRITSSSQVIGEAETGYLYIYRAFDMRSEPQWPALLPMMTPGETERSPPRRRGVDGIS